MDFPLEDRCTEPSNADISSALLGWRAAGHAPEGREGAFALIHARYRGPIESFLSRKTGAGPHVDDLAQEVMIRVYKHLHRYDPDRKFTTWLYTIANNIVKNVYRDRARERILLESDFPADAEVPVLVCDRTPDEDLGSSAARSLVRSALSHLPNHLQEVLYLRDIVDLTYEEIATRTGQNLGTVKSRLNRARSGLGRAVAALDSDYGRRPAA